MSCTVPAVPTQGAIPEVGRYKKKRDNLLEASMSDRASSVAELSTSLLLLFTIGPVLGVVVVVVVVNADLLLSMVGLLLTRLGATRTESNGGEKLPGRTGLPGKGDCVFPLAG